MTQSEEKFFDLHVRGLGYLNRARKVEVKRGQDFLAVEINALHGASDTVQYTRFDCRVSGRDAQRVIEQLMPAINDDGKKVLIGFRIGDCYLDTYTPNSEGLEINAEQCERVKNGIAKVLTDAVPDLNQEQVDSVQRNLCTVLIKALKEAKEIPCLKARLLYIAWAKVDGESVYRAPKPDQDTDQSVGVDSEASTTESLATAKDASAAIHAEDRQSTDSGQAGLNAPTH